jgi:hypothetical protein
MDRARLRLAPARERLGFVLILFCTVSSIYGTSASLPERARILPQFIIVSVAVLCGYLSGIRLSEWFSTSRHIGLWTWVTGSIAMIILVIQSPLAATLRTMSLAKPSKDERGHLGSDGSRSAGRLRARVEMDFIVPNFRNRTLGKLFNKAALPDQHLIVRLSRL